MSFFYVELDGIDFGCMVLIKVYFGIIDLLGQVRVRVVKRYFGYFGWYWFVVREHFLGRVDYTFGRRFWV